MTSTTATRSWQISSTHGPVSFVATVQADRESAALAILRAALAAPGPFYPHRVELPPGCPPEVVCLQVFFDPDLLPLPQAPAALHPSHD